MAFEDEKTARAAAEKRANALITANPSGVSLADVAAYKHAESDAIIAPENGTVMWEVNGDGECVTSIDPMVGKEYKEGERFCYLQNQYGQIVEVPAALGGKLVEVCAKQGSKVRKGDTIAFIRRK